MASAGCAVDPRAGIRQPVTIQAVRTIAVPVEARLTLVLLKAVGPTAEHLRQAPKAQRPAAAPRMAHRQESEITKTPGIMVAGAAVQATLVVVKPVAVCRDLIRERIR